MDTPTKRSAQPPRTTAVQRQYVVQQYYSTAHSRQKNIQQPTKPQCVYENSTTAVQQYSRKNAEARMPETTGDGTYSGQKQNKKITAVAVVRRTTPERGRYGSFCLSTPLHAPRSPSTYTAVDVYSSTCHTAEHALVQSLFLCRAGMDVQQHISTCFGTGTVQGFPFFTNSPPPRGASDPSPGGQRATLPASRVGHGTRYSPGTEKGCCVGGTWRHSETAGGQELETRSCSWVCYNENIF